MTKTIQRSMLMLGLSIFAVTMLTAGTAQAGNNFSSIASNIIASIANLPALLSGLAYMFGILLAVLGIMKIKDHVENPGQTKLSEGAIRLLAGGALFMIPIISEAMSNTVGSGTAATAATLTNVQFNAGP